MSNSSTPRWHDWEATYRGAAAIALGGIPLLMVLPALQIGLWMANRGRYGGYESERMLLVFGGLLVISVLLVTSFFGVAQGLAGWVAARRTREPRALCYAGMLFGMLAILGWLWHASVWIEWAERTFR
jgi:hypothetical protein